MLCGGCRHDRSECRRVHSQGMRCEVCPAPGMRCGRCTFRFCTNHTVHECVAGRSTADGSFVPSGLQGPSQTGLQAQNQGQPAAPRVRPSSGGSRRSSESGLGRVRAAELEAALERLEHQQAERYSQLEAEYARLAERSENQTEAAGAATAASARTRPWSVDNMGAVDIQATERRDGGSSGVRGARSADDPLAPRDNVAFPEEPPQVPVSPWWEQAGHVDECKPDP